MGSGHLGYRKIIKRDTTWIDKNTEKHKHDFAIHSILKQITPKGRVEYFNIMKCNQCNSFKSIPKPGSVQGFIGDKLTENEKKLPLIIGYKKHEYLIGFYDIERLE